MTLLRWLTFLLRFLTATLAILVFQIYLFLLMLVFALKWLSLRLGNSDHVAVSVSIDFPANSERDVPFHCKPFGYSHANWDGLCDHLRDVPWADIFKFNASAVAAAAAAVAATAVAAAAAPTEFCEWVHARIDVYIPHCKYQARHHLSPWFSAACAAAIVHQNHFFRLYQQNKSSESKVKFRQTSNCCNLKLPNLHMLIKQKSLSLSTNLALRIFAKLLKMFSTKVNLLYLLYSTAWRCCLLHLIKQNCLLKTFLKTLILKTQISLYLIFLLELVWNCIIFL